ncbi:hypothetical protein [Corynebacterium qintianiae]|uniref:hypothetical protein n=1 Tax=Corynebacterium qintianiae TaxID=2709392 RepID=UPI0013EE3537|nr:hypothetical protein [Corynebacterium qintianiae]
MPKVTLGKATRYPFGSKQVHRSGTVLDVTIEDEQIMRERGLLVDVPQPATVVLEPEPEPQQEDAPAAPSTSGTFPQLPKKTAPVAEWKEYARRNGIKLTGLSKRNEIMGFVTKTVNESH